MTAADRSPREERRIRRTVAGGTALMHVLGRTWRERWLNVDPVQALRERGQPMVLACWHGELLPLLWYHRHRGISVLISEHRDGEMIARVAEHFGFRTIRGSTTRGGGRALLALVRALEEGSDVAITPDGPRGPAHRYAPGALVAAHRAGAPIVPVGLGVDRAWRLSSWDRFVIPKPLARTVIAYGEPTWVSAADARGAAEQTERFAELHQAANRLAAG